MRKTRPASRSRGGNLGDYAMLQHATKVDPQKSLAELTAAMQKMATKDTPVDQGSSTHRGQLAAARDWGATLRFWWTLRRSR
jgi:hypothetical protein